MKLANEDVTMLAFTSEQITAPFLLPEMVMNFVFTTPLSEFLVCWPSNMTWFSEISLIDFFTMLYCFQTEIGCCFFQVERVASMLNYFLLQLVGPQRKSLSLKDPEKYEFRPKQLLKQVAFICSK